MATKDITDEQVVQACRDWHADHRIADFSLNLLMRRTGQPEKVCYRAMERALDRGLIECGVSLRTAWPVRNV